MAQGKQALKQRIRSINATKKITSAMALIANSKLQKQRSLMEKNLSSDKIRDTLTKEYMLDEEKANLIIDIAIRQKDYIYPLDRDRYSLYIAIPFVLLDVAIVPLQPFQ